MIIISHRYTTIIRNQIISTYYTHINVSINLFDWIFGKLKFLRNTSALPVQVTVAADATMRKVKQVTVAFGQMRAQIRRVWEVNCRMLQPSVDRQLRKSLVWSGHQQSSPRLRLLESGIWTYFVFVPALSTLISGHRTAGEPLHNSLFVIGNSLFAYNINCVYLGSWVALQITLR